MLFNPNSLPINRQWLFKLNEIGTALGKDYLDHKESFIMITNKLIKPLEEEMKNQTDEHEALQKFSALFYSRCIDTNVDTCSARPIIKHILSLDKSKLVMMMTPVVLRLLVVEEHTTPGIFMALITDPNCIKNCPCLQNIDKEFKDLFQKGLIHHDSYPAVMICDLIQSLQNFEEHFNIDDIDSSDCEVLEIAKSAATLVSQNDESCCGLKVVAAVAFLRGFITMLVKFIAKPPSVLKKDSPFVRVMTEVNSLLKVTKSSSQLFFLKQLHQHVSLFDLRKWFGDNNVLPALKELWCNEMAGDKAVFTSVFKYPEYEEAKAAYWKLSEKEESTRKEFLTKCSSSPSHAFALLGILINMVYLKRYVQKLTDKEEYLVDWFAKNVVPFPLLFKELLLRIIGRQDFACSQLQLSPESPVEDVEMALLVLHVACVVATGALHESIPMYRYFTNPIQFEQPCVLAHRTEKLYSVYKNLPSVDKCVVVTCTCNLRLALKSTSTDEVCPHCHNVLSREMGNNTSSVKTSVSCSTKQTDWDVCIDHMNPAVYRALHLIVYLSYFGGIALGTSTREKLSVALNLLRGFDPETESNSPESFCFENMRTDLLHLMKILRCRRDIAIETMHRVVEKSSDLMRSNNLLEANDCSTPEMRQEWEYTFSQLTEAVFLDVREASQELKETKQLQQINNSQSLEYRILELDSYPKVPKEQNQQLKRLYRVTKEPCYKDFRSAFLLSPKKVQERHRFLTLFFAKFEQLPIIGHLYHLLKWSRLVSSALTHRISRKDSEKSINDFIIGYLLEINRSKEEKKYLKELFNNFKVAWDDMVPLVNQQLVSKNVAQMESLTETDHVAYCLTESDFGVYLQTAIEILVSLQNSILDAMISLSSSHQHPALSFFEKDNCSGVMSVSIQEVKEKEIVSFQWTDRDLLTCAKSDLEYGKGQKITYDFERIEMLLAKKIGFGKCYLTGTLNKFIFAKELFHSCGPLLTEIRSLLTQSLTLPENVRKGLFSLKERRIKEAQDLLHHFEVLIFLLKLKLKHFDMEMTLKDLAEKWSPMLPSPFPVNLLPEPQSSIKMKHVTALYEALEDVLADGVIDGLARKFRHEMTIHMKNNVRTMVKKEIDQLKPHNFLNALRRFVFRYLSSGTERYWPEETETFRCCLKEPSLWSPFQPPNLEEIPKEITLKYIYSVVKYLEELEQKRKDKERTSNTTRPGLGSSARRPQTVTKQGRRQLKNYFRD